MISYPAALKLIEEETLEMPFNKEQCSNNNLIGRRVTDDIYSNEQLPSFNNSAMDGFALNTKSLENNNNLILNVQDYIQAGQVNTNIEYDINCACEITTGSVVPSQYNTVIPVEDVDIIEQTNNKPSIIKLKYQIIADKNVRKKGEDFELQDLIIKKSEEITSRHIMSFAALGIAEVSVYKKPKIAILSTGTEVVDDITAPLLAGKIRNSNSPYLQAFLNEAGADVSYYGVLEDDLESFKDKILTITESDKSIDAIVTTGSVSMGRYDLIPEAIKQIGGKIIFHKVQIRPGKPILFAKLPNNKLFFGLPGNPISTAVGARFFVLPWLRRAQAVLSEQPIKAELLNNIQINNKFNYFKKAYMSFNDGRVKCEILDGQESFKIKPFQQSNCYAVFPIKKIGAVDYKQGDLVNVYSTNYFNDQFIK